LYFGAIESARHLSAGRFFFCSSSSLKPKPMALV